MFCSNGGGVYVWGKQFLWLTGLKAISLLDPINSLIHSNASEGRKVFYNFPTSNGEFPSLHPAAAPALILVLLFLPLTFRIRGWGVRDLLHILLSHVLGGWEGAGGRGGWSAVMLGLDARSVWRRRGKEVGNDDSPSLPSLSRPQPAGSKMESGTVAADPSQSQGSAVEEWGG